MAFALAAAFGCAQRSASEARVDAPATPPDAGDRFVVTALDERGAPVPGAVVWILERDGLDPVEAAFTARVTGDLVETSRVLASHTGTTDALGRAAFEFIEAANVLAAGEHGPLFGQIELVGTPAERRANEAVIRLENRRAFEVLVTHANGDAAASIPVTAGVETPVPGATDGRTRSDLLPVTARTDANGRATLYLPRGFERGRAFARARIASEERSSAELVQGRAARIELPATSALELRVVDRHDLAPIEGGFVQLFALRDGSVSDATLVRRIAEGRVRFPAVELGAPLNATCVLRTPSGYGRAKVRVEPIGESTDTATIEIDTTDLTPILE